MRDIFRPCACSVADDSTPDGGCVRQMPRQELLRSPTKAPTKSPTKSPKKSPLRSIMMGRGAIFKTRTNVAKLRRTATSEPDSGPDEGHNARLDLWWRASVGIGHRRRATPRPPHRTKHRQQGRRGCELVHEATEQGKGVRESRGEAHAWHRCSLVRANCMPPRCCRRAVECNEEGVPGHPSDHVLLSLGGKGACS